MATEPQFYFAAISASADGTLAVRPPPAAVPINADMNASNAELRLVDRSGTGNRVGAARLFSSLMALNPIDSRILAASILDPRAGTQDLGLMDLTKDSMAPLTATRGFAGYPVWSADGRRLAYAYQPPGGLDDVYIKDIATGSIQPVIESPGITEHPLAWSHDAKSLLIFGSGDNGTYLSAWSFVSRTLTRFVGPRAVETPACFSPHDDFVAFTSQESGRPEVYVATFPDHRRTWPVTTEGGRALSWRNDGREILVATLSGHIVAYPVSTEGGSRTASPRRSSATSGSRWPTARPRAIIPASSFASVRTRPGTRARFGCSSGGRTRCARAGTNRVLPRARRSNQFRVSCDGLQARRTSSRFGSG